MFLVMYLNPTTLVVNKEAFFMPLNCIFFSPKIFYVYPNAMLEIIVRDVDNKCVTPPKKPKKVVVDVNCKFQETWVMKMPWAESIYNEVNLVSIVKYCFVP